MIRNAHQENMHSWKFLKIIKEFQLCGRNCKKRKWKTKCFVSSRDFFFFSFSCHCLGYHYCQYHHYRHHHYLLNVVIIITIIMIICLLNWSNSCIRLFTSSDYAVLWKRKFYINNLIEIMTLDLLLRRILLSKLISNEGVA